MHDRIEELDALRGLMLVWITCTHLPTILSAYVNQPLGFFSASEGFIFLSALFTGRIYFRIAERNGYGPMWWKIWVASGKTVLLPTVAAGVCLRDRSPDCGARQDTRGA